MYRLALLIALALLTVGTTGCFHNNSCGTGWRPGSLLFGNRQPAAAAQPLPCCPQPVQCCDPCAGMTTVGSPVISAPMAAPCCQ